MLLAFYTNTSNKKENYQRNLEQHFPDFEGCPKTLLQTSTRREGRAQETANEHHTASTCACTHARSSFPSQRQGCKPACVTAVHRHHPGSPHRRRSVGVTPWAPFWGSGTGVSLLSATWVWAPQASTLYIPQRCVNCSEHCVFVRFVSRQVGETMVKEIFCEMYTRLALNSLCRPSWSWTPKSACLCLPGLGIKDRCHHNQP